MYVYTHLKQDGTYVVLDKCKSKWDYERIRKFIGGYIEYIPSTYNPDNMKGNIIGHEEGRFNSSNHRNPFTKVLFDDWGMAWDCVGDLLLEQTEKQFNAWQESL